jgi:hypothetical protein
MDLGLLFVMAIPWVGSKLFVFGGQVDRESLNINSIWLQMTMGKCTRVQV